MLNLPVDSFWASDDEGLPEPESGAATKPCTDSFQDECLAQTLLRTTENSAQRRTPLRKTRSVAAGRIAGHNGAESRIPNNAMTDDSNSLRARISALARTCMLQKVYRSEEPADMGHTSISESAEKKMRPEVNNGAHTARICNPPDRKGIQSSSGRKHGGIGETQGNQSKSTCKLKSSGGISLQPRDKRKASFSEDVQQKDVKRKRLSSEFITEASVRSRKKRNSQSRSLDIALGRKKNKNRPGQRARKKIYSQLRGDDADTARKPRQGRKESNEGVTHKQATSEAEHPSWVARRNESAQLSMAPQGKKIIFGDNGPVSSTRESKPIPQTVRATSDARADRHGKRHSNSTKPFQNTGMKQKRARSKSTGGICSGISDASGKDVGICEADHSRALTALNTRASKASKKQDVHPSWVAKTEARKVEKERLQAAMNGNCLSTKITFSD